MPIKILVISNYRDYISTRPEATIFIDLAKRGFEVHVMTHEDASFIPDFEEAGITVVPFHPLRKFDTVEIQIIRNYLIENAIDIMHLFNNKAIVNGIIAAKKLPVKVVLYRSYEGNVAWYDPLSYTKFLHPRVTGIVCTSDGIKEFMQRRMLFGRDKNVTILKGHELDWYEKVEPVDIKKELGLPVNSFLLVNTANNRKMKGIPYLLKAMGKLKEKKDIHLLLIGKDMDNSVNMKIIRKLGINENVHFLGFRKDALNIMAACNVFTLSSIYGESITKAVVEAMSQKIPAIISDIAGNRMLIKHEESGLVFPSKNVDALKDAIMRMYSDSEMCKRMGEAARERINTVLNHKQTVDKYHAYYESLMKH